MVLKMYVDDSGLFHEPVSCLGGWIADAETWRRFNEDWKKELQIEPRLDYFKLREAKAGRGQFSRISIEEKDQRIKRFMQIIADHRLIYGTILISPKVFRDRYLQAGHQPPSIYLALLYMLVTETLSYTASKGKIDPIEFVFDEQGGQMRQILEAWTEFRSCCPPEVSNRIPESPVFVTDQEALPLQAADALVWYQRRSAIRSLNGEAVEESPFPWAGTDQDPSGFISAALSADHGGATVIAFDDGPKAFFRT
ncbi:hypothetical protein EOS93_24770 [Rhizobium sp. RMa-01]|uniref:DUF3800 domain-containing protein n=1 Tax=unclassified Rhizobium TaxID=2613769 RepID=UPI000ABB55DE|nr:MULTISPECIES: DUF3800 domain-containing protein [unclassified Rhizobium]RVU08274.1 hypothetical protein EOS93_24770 [Rhizobium sp. RMa-01]